MCSMPLVCTSSFSVPMINRFGLLKVSCYYFPLIITWMF
jgi:hypothetical protein